MFYGNPEAAFHKVYNGDPLSVWITGGGMSFVDILKIPGCSKFLNEIVIPYSNDSFNKFLYEQNLPTINQFCSNDASYQAAMCLYKRFPQATCLAVTAAMTTNRYRRGDNRAYFCRIRPVNGKTVITNWRLNIFHTSEEAVNKLGLVGSLRNREDKIIALSMMYILTGDDTFNPFNNRSESDIQLFRSVYGDDTGSEFLEKIDETVI